MYDAANQLIRENLYYGTGNSNNATITYQYDSWGNLLNKKIYAYTTGTLGAVQETVTYTYGNSSWQDQLTSYNGQSITYDASGNPTNYLGAVLAWEGQRLKSYTPASTGSGRVNAYTYNYDENGIRTRKTVGNTVTDYYYNGSLLIGIVQTTTNSDGSTETSMQRFSYDADGKVVGVNYNGTYYYYLRNAQGDIVKLIDKTGSTVVEYTYDTWGKLLSTTGSLAATFGAEQPFRYRGYVYDEETGFYYLQSRYYNPEVGRFISADVYLSTGQGVLGHNSYAYCLNNPVNMTDESGQWSLPNWAKKVVAAVTIVAAVAAAAVITVATAGAGTAAAVIAVGAAKGAAIGMVSGAAIGAASGAVNHRLSTGSWNGADTAALDGMGNGALSGAITGAVTGAASSAAKVMQAAKAWDASSKGGPLKNMSDHYYRHVLQEGKKSMTKNIITYTNDAKALWNSSNGVGKIMSSGSIRLKDVGIGGFYSPSGLIRSFFYQ